MARDGTLRIAIVGDDSKFKRTLDDTSSSLQSWGSKLPGILGAAGAVAGGALAAGLFEAFERDAATDRLGASLGLTPSEMDSAGRIAGEVYAEAFGDSIGEVNQAIEGVASTLGGFADLGEDRIGDLTRDALTIADVFNLDVSEAISSAGVLLNSGLVEDAEEAFDTITRGLQEMPAGLRTELLEASTEYGKFFEDLGFNASEAFGVLVAASEDGMYGIDKAGDAIKEFVTRSTDMSARTQEAFDTIGLDAETMAERILEGGDTARGAFDDIVEGLLGIEDPVDQASAAVALFGTPLEDLSVGEIPEFLEQLANIESGLDDVEGATDRVGDTAYDNIETRFSEAWRTAQNAFLLFADEHLLPKIEEIIDAFEEDGLGGALDTLMDLWDEAWPDIEAWLENTAAPALIEFGGTVGQAMAEALWDAFVATIRTSPFEDVIPDWDPLGVGDFMDDFWNWGSRNDPTPGRTAEPPNRSRSSGGTRRGGGGGSVIMHDGGIVPGVRNQEVPVLAEAGELVIPADLVRSLQERTQPSPTMFDITVNNPAPEPASTSISRTMRTMQHAGVFG